MRRILLLSSILLVSAMWAAAQVNSASSGPVTNSISNNVTVQGCLGGDVGELTLTNRAGTSYQLTGNTQNMYQDVGHTVVVTGVKPSGSPLPGSMAANADTRSDTPASLTVISFEDVAPSCSETQ